MNNRSAISWFDWPAATSSTTRCSVAVSGAPAGRLGATRASSDRARSAHSRAPRRLKISTAGPSASRARAFWRARRRTSPAVSSARAVDERDAGVDGHGRWRRPTRREPHRPGHARPRARPRARCASASIQRYAGRRSRSTIQASARARASSTRPSATRTSTPSTTSVHVDAGLSGSSRRRREQRARSVDWRRRCPRGRARALRPRPPSTSVRGPAPGWPPTAHAPRPRSSGRLRHRREGTASRWDSTFTFVQPRALAGLVDAGRRLLERRRRRMTSPVRHRCLPSPAAAAAARASRRARAHAR